jgi:adenine-specific DNA-methyltransferase
MRINQKPSRKETGAYYTPDGVVSALVSWAVRRQEDRLLDPSCGDGRFIAGHRNSVGIEQDPEAAREAVDRAPWALVHEGEFFAWAENTNERFDCAAGNPPFIRYQTFRGDVRARALRHCARLGAEFTGLTSSWAPFLVAAAGLLKRGGRMAFVVPAEIGHAPYSAPLLDYLLRNFSTIQIIAIRRKLFPQLSEDCWLLYAEGFGGCASGIRFSVQSEFRRSPAPPSQFETVPVREWRGFWNCRLRPYLLPAAARAYYKDMTRHPGTCRLGDIASVGIGYVTGANSFFHLRPSKASFWGVPNSLLYPTVRNGRVLPRQRLTTTTVEEWRRNDEPMFLLRIPKDADLPEAVRNYLDTNEGHTAREAYKCRVRDPWYSVPDVQIPDFFLSYMSGEEPSLVYNEAHCTCTNSLHGVRLKEPVSASDLLQVWESWFVKLSCELEGHPLGGGMLKLEPREAGRIVLPLRAAHKQMDNALVEEAVTVMREWRHYANVSKE